MKSFASTHKIQGNQKGSLAAQALRDNYMKVKQEKTMVANDENLLVSSSATMQPRGLMSQYLNAKCVNSQNGLKSSTSSSFFNSISTKKNQTNSNSNVNWASCVVQEGASTNNDTRQNTKQKFQQSVSQYSNSNHRFQHSHIKQVQVKNSVNTEKEIAQLLKSNMDLPGDLVSTLKSSISSSNLGRLISKQKSTKKTKIRTLKQNDILKVQSQPTSTSSLRQPTSQVIFVAPFDENAQSQRIPRQLIRVQSNSNVTTTPSIFNLPDISNSRLLLPVAGNRQNSLSSNQRSGSSSNINELLVAEDSPQQAQRRNKIATAYSVSSLNIPQSRQQQNQENINSESSSNQPEVLISINSNDNNIMNGENPNKASSPNIKKRKKSKMSKQQQHYKSMQQLLKYKKDKLVNDKYQMYGKQSNNNEILNILKEERLFQNMSQKQSRDMKKLKELMTQKMIEELIRDRIQQSLPNSNQLESIIQDVLHNRHRSQDINQQTQNNQDQQVQNQNALISENSGKNEQFFRQPRQKSQNRRLKMREQYVQQIQQEEQPQVRQQLGQIAKATPNRTATLVTNQQESIASISEFNDNESEEFQESNEVVKTNNNTDIMSLVKRKTFSQFSPINGRYAKNKSIRLSNANNIRNLMRKCSKYSGSDKFLQLPAYDLDNPRTQKMLIRLPSIGSENSHSNLNNSNKLSHKQSIKNRRITVVNGKKMQLISRHKLNSGAGGWPKLVTQTAKRIREESVLISPQLKRTNTAKNSSSSEYSDSSASEQDEDTKFFKWQVNVCKYMSKETKKIGQSKQFNRSTRKLLRIQTGLSTASKQTMSNQRQTTNTFKKTEQQFGIFTRYQNDFEIARQQEIAQQYRKKAHNRIDYDTKTKIMYDDRFKPVEKNLDEKLKQLQEINFTEEELYGETKPQWHQNLQKKFPQIWEMKEIKLRQEGKPWKHDRVIKDGVMKVDRKLFHIDQLKHNRLIRQSSMPVIRFVDPDCSQDQLFLSKSDRDFVPRLTNKLNAQKYKQLVEQQMHNSRSICSTSPNIEIMKQNNTFDKKQQRRLTKSQRRSKKNLFEVQARNLIPKGQQQSFVSKKDLRKASKLFRGQKFKISADNTSVYKSSSEDQTLSKNFEMDSDQFEKLEMTPIASIGYFQNKFDSDNQTNFNNYAQKLPNNKLSPQKDEPNKKITSLMELTNQIGIMKTENQLNTQSSFKNGAAAHIRHTSNASQEKGSIALSMLKQKFNSILAMSKSMFKKSHTFINLPQLCQIENNMEIKELEQRLTKEQTVVNMMEEGINMLQSTKKQPQSPDQKNAKKNYPQNYMHPFNKEIISKIKTEINIELLKYLEEAEIDWEFYLESINNVDFSFDDQCDYQQLQYLKHIKENRKKIPMTLTSLFKYLEKFLLRPDLGNPNYRQTGRKFEIDYYNYNLKRSIVSDKQHFMKIHCYQINSFTQKQLLDIFYRPNLPNQLFNRLHKKLDWSQLEKNKDKIIIAMPPQYISDYADFIKLRQNRPLNAINPTVNISKNRRKFNVILRFVSSTKHFSYKFHSDENPHEFQLLNKFIYYSVLERVNPSLSCELFAYGLNPKLRKQQAKKTSAGDTNLKSNSEVDSYNMLQSMAQGHEGSFLSTNTIKTNLQGSVFEQKFRKNLMLAGIQQQNEMDSSANNAQLYQRQNFQGIQDSLFGKKRETSNNKLSTASFLDINSNQNHHNKPELNKNHSQGADENQFAQLRKMQSLAFNLSKQHSSQENTSLLPVPAQSTGRAILKNKSLSGGMKGNKLIDIERAVLGVNNIQNLNLSKTPRLTEGFESENLSQRSYSQDRTQTQGMNIQKKLLGFQVPFEGGFKPQRTTLYMQETINEEAATPQQSRLDISPYKIALNLIGTSPNGTNRKNGMLNSPSLTKSRFLTTETGEMHHSQSLQVNQYKKNRELKNLFGVRDNVYDLENSDISAEDSIISMTTSEEDEQSSLVNSFITYHEEVEGPSERVQMFQETNVNNLIQRQNNLLINIGYNSDGVIVEGMHKKVEDQFYTPQPSPSIRDLDNLIPGLNSRKLNTRSNRLMNSTMMRANLGNNTRKKKKKLHMRFESFAEQNNIAYMAIQAVKENNLKKIQEMFTRFHGLDLETKDHNGNTLLNTAAQNCSTQIVEMLLKKGAFIDTQNKQLNTPLHYAKAYNFTKIVDMFITKGANQNILNAKGQNPWEGIG